jgi:hypothetical protein
MRNGHIRKYLRQAEQEAHQNTLGFAGEGKMGADGWLQRPMNYRPFTADAEQGRFYPADGSSGGGAGAPVSSATYSQPYIVQVSNASAATVTDFDIWGAIIYLNNSQYTFTNGSLVDGAITVSSGMPSPITYYTMLQQSNTSVFTIGLTTLLVIAGPNGQINQPWTIKTFDANGNYARKTLPNVTQPNQYQSGVINNYMQYDIDGSTALSLNILGNSVFQLLFYPLANINLSRSLLGQNSAKSFAPPPSNLPPQPVLIAQ